MKTKLFVVVLLSLAVALPVLGWTYKYTYPIACRDLWPSVKETRTTTARTSRSAWMKRWSSRKTRNPPSLLRR